MRIFLAASYGRRYEMRVYRAELQTHGHAVTSSWIDEDLSAMEEVALSPAEKAEYARRDLDDILASELFALFTDPPGQSRSLGGRHTELGAALSIQGIRIVLIGEPENIYHHLPEITRVPDWQSFLADLLANRI